MSVVDFFEHRPDATDQIRDGGATEAERRGGHVVLKIAMIGHRALMQEIAVVTKGTDKWRNEFGRHTVRIDHSQAFVDRKWAHVLLDGKRSAAIGERREAHFAQVISGRHKCAK